MLSHAFIAATLAGTISAPLAQSAAAPSDRRVTVIGCVERSEPDVVGTTGTTTLGPDQTRYVLVNITLAADANPTETADAVAASVPAYRLDDSKDPVIAPHVGEKVEVTGVVQTTTRPNGDAPRVTAPASAMPLLKVEKLIPIAGPSASCRAR